MNAGCPQVLVLNGGSSSGKTTLARSLQEVLDGYRLRLGVDTLVDAAPSKLFGVGGLDLAEDGSVGVGADFVEVERQWRSGVAAMAAVGAHILVEDNFVAARSRNSAGTRHCAASPSAGLGSAVRTTS